MKRAASPFSLAAGALFLLCLFLFFHRLADRDLWSSHEARAGMDAQSILDGEGLLPRLFDGRPELQKPPLYYWLVAAIARAREGPVDAWAVRLPSALAALACVALVVGLGWGAGRPIAGLCAGLVLATTMHFTWLARIGRIDVPLALTVSVAVAALYRALARPDGSRFASGVGYVAIAAGVLLKGPIGVVLPAAILAAHLLCEGRWPAFWELGAWRRLGRELGLAWGVPLVLALTVPVFWWAEVASGGQFFHEFFWAHNVERALGGGRLRAHAWWLYVPYFLLYFLPWSPLLLVAVVGRRCRFGPEAQFGLAWALAVLLVLSCARFKRADYLAPAYPGAALFVGCALERWAFSLGARRVLAGVVGVALIVAGAWAHQLAWKLPTKEPYRDYRAFAGEVRRAAPAPARVYFFRTEAHALAFHVGRPLVVVVDWAELQAHLRQPGPHHLVMPPDAAEDCPRHLRGVRLEVVARNTDGGRHERPLVLLRSSGADVQKTE